MPPVWPWGGAPWYTVGAPQPTAPITPSRPQTTAPITPSQPQPTATTMYIVPANMPGSYERGYERKTMGDDGKEQKWWFDPYVAKQTLDRLRGLKAIEDLQRYGMIVRPSAYELAAVIQGYPLNEAAYEEFKKYYDQFMKERYYNYDLRKELEIAKNPPQWIQDMWKERGGEPEWYKETRQRAVEMLPGYIEKYQPEPLQRPQPVSQAPQTQPPATQALPPASQTQVPPIQRPIWQWERDYGYGGRED
jgi:hypothetical protein